MKKAFVLLTMLVAVISVAVLSACTGGGESPKPEHKLLPYVSYEESSLLLASGDDYNLEVVFFRTENPKQMDGKVAAPLTGKVRISYIPLKLGGIDQAVAFIYLGISGTLQKSVTKFELTTEFETTATPDTNFTLSINKDEELITLTDVTKDVLSANAALELASKELKLTLAPEFEAGFQREIIIKIISDKMGEKPFYFYVSFYASPEKFSAVLIDPDLKKVVAKKM